ncbi:MAG TPA: HEAT repeat domain-containing protein [Vicinamibacterales bacterium]
MRRELSFCLLLLLAASSAFAQVHVDVRLEKNRYLAGEPIVLLVEVRNVGDEAVGYSTCDGDVRLEVAGVERRTSPNIFGCFSSILSGGGCGIDHPQLLQPGQTTTFRYLLRDYDLRPGQYQLSAFGKAGVRWKYYPVYAPNVPPPSPPEHKETDPVPGAQFERRLSLAVVAATQRQLRDAFAPLVSDADGTDPVKRYQARAAIVESAPPFLEPLIARFAAEDPFGTTAIDALGRIASRNSRLQLRKLARDAREARRSAAVLALARVGHRDDADFLANLLRDETMDQTARRYAAIGLGHIGGDASVRHLQRALDTVPPEIRPAIATALGNTRSRLAVPVLIGMFGNNPSRNDVCSALRTLTHRHWCDGTADDPAATRRQWLRTWNEGGSKTPIFGPAECPRI